MRLPATRDEMAALLFRAGLARAYCALARRARSGAVSSDVRAAIEREALEAIAGADEAAGEFPFDARAARHDAEQGLRVVFAHALNA